MCLPARPPPLVSIPPTRTAYVLADGAHVLQVFDGPVNYQDDTGDWVPIKPALVSDGQGSLQNKAAPFNLAFPELWTGSDPVEVDMSDGTFAFSVSGAQPTAVSKDDKDTITYAGVLPGVDVRFDSNTEGYRGVVRLFLWHGRGDARWSSRSRRRASRSRRSRPARST